LEHHLDTIIHRDVLQHLFAHYECSLSVRRQMAVLNGALVRACETGVDTIELAHIASAIAE
jgi:hypothetical protein